MKRPYIRKVRGWVWCDHHGCIHEDTTDPYGYGEPDCSKLDHRSVLVRAEQGETFS